jgi:hypothetical protein
MPADSLQEQGLQVNRTRTGRFAKGRSGNPAGRQPGSRNRATVIAEQLLDCEVRSLTRKALDMALGGDAAALRLCLDRIIGPRRERPIRFTLPPIEDAGDLHAAMSSIATAVARGEITSGEAYELSQVVDTFIRAIDASEVERRLKRVEAALAREP